MDKLRVIWNHDEEQENILKFGVNFREAKEVVLNASSLKLRNLYKDFQFIGPVNDLSKILVVNCIPEEGFRKVRWARKASLKEQNAYFNFLANGDLQ